MASEELQAHVSMCVNSLMCTQSSTAERVRVVSLGHYKGLGCLIFVEVSNGQQK